MLGGCLHLCKMKSEKVEQKCKTKKELVHIVEPVSVRVVVEDPV